MIFSPFAAPALSVNEHAYYFCVILQRLAPADDDGGGDGSGSGGDKEDGTSQGQHLTGHKRLAAAWFGEDGTGSIPREKFASFVRDLRKDATTVECRLYSCITPA